MQIAAERAMVPRPLQRPSDVERRPIDFGIEPNAPAPARPEATIIKSAISQETELVVEHEIRSESHQQLKQLLVNARAICCQQIGFFQAKLRSINFRNSTTCFFDKQDSSGHVPRLEAGGPESF